MIPIHAYEGRRVAVFGLGRTGISAARALLAGGAKVSAWDDNEEARLRAVEAGLELDDLNRRDWGDVAALVLSPGVPLTHPEPHRMVQFAQAVGAPVIGDVELLALEIARQPEASRPKIIGITGTNGKSTTTALIGHILKTLGHDARIGGNIGRAVLDLEPPRAGAILVLELSSYQIDLTYSLDCDIAVFLNIAPDHLDRHGGFDGYFAAKSRLLDMQGEGRRAVIGVDDPQLSALYTKLRGERGPTAMAAISGKKLLAQGAYALAGDLYDAMGGSAKHVLRLAEAPTLPGRHNAQNAAAAFAVTRMLGLNNGDVAGAMKSFSGLPHRQEWVGRIGPVDFINDSKATNPQAAAQAIACYDKVWWIGGGRAKEEGLEALKPCLDRIAKAYLIGEAAPAFERALKGKVETVRSRALDAAVRAAAADAAASGDKGVVLLSPACASFDQFRDFEARGDAFRDLAFGLGATRRAEAG